MACTIMISEGQRALLAELLANNREVIERHRLKHLDPFDDTLEQHNLNPDALIKMFENLPADAVETPNALHGFCL